MACRHVLLLERSPALREVLQVVCAEDGLDVRVCPSLTDLWTAATGQVGEVALVDEHEIDGLLAEEHGGDLGRLSRRVPLVLIAEGCPLAADACGGLHRAHWLYRTAAPNRLRRGYTPMG
jgi:hypothetical protein